MAQRNGGPWGKGNWVREGFPEMGTLGGGMSLGKGKNGVGGCWQSHFMNPFLMCAHLKMLATETLCRLLYSPRVLAPPWPSVTPWGRPKAHGSHLKGPKN